MSVNNEQAGSSLTIINLTAHPVSVYAGNVCLATFPKSQIIPMARVLNRHGEEQAFDCLFVGIDNQLSSAAITIQDISIEPYGVEVPDPEPGVVLLVSRLTALALPDRDDLVFPHDEVRDESGRIVGCARLGRFVRRAV